jgi:hypothetical protein
MGSSTSRASDPPPPSVANVPPEFADVVMAEKSEYFDNRNLTFAVQPGLHYEAESEHSFFSDRDSIS